MGSKPIYNLNNNDYISSLVILHQYAINCNSYDTNKLTCDDKIVRTNVQY